MLRVGLTGAIGAGKSTVAALLRQRGIPVLEADDLVRALTRPGMPVLAQIVEAFGREVLREDGELDRARLAARVFTDPDRLAQLNRIVHPPVLERMRRWLAEQQGAGAPLAVVEAPLLFESGLDRELDRVVVVWCRPERLMERLVARGLSPEEARARLAAQMDPEAKRARADEVIDNSGTIEQTRRQVDALLERLRRLTAAAPSESGPS